MDLGLKGKSALALSRDLNVSYKCAFVLLHKLREAMASIRPTPVLFPTDDSSWK